MSACGYYIYSPRADTPKTSPVTVGHNEESEHYIECDILVISIPLPGLPVQYHSEKKGWYFTRKISYSMFCSKMHVKCKVHVECRMLVKRRIDI